jgi:hypothetical protein
MPPKIKSPTGRNVRDLLDKYACPVPHHEVRTRFLGAIASPTLAVSPLPIVQGLWGGELPLFDSMEDANELMNVLVNGLWNSLTRHNSRSEPFRLQRLALEPSAQNLARIAQVRRQELDGFVEGLFNGQDRVNLPERAHRALGCLGEHRATMVGIEDLVVRGIEVESSTQLETTFKLVSKLTKIAEAEIHEAVMSCARARRQMLAGIELPRSSFH